MSQILTGTLYFSLILLAALAVGKVVLIGYRMATHRWPASARYLLEIVEWKKEAGKISLLIAAAFLISFLKRLI